jgi:Ca2+-binding EF-hand superfamily protein
LNPIGVKQMQISQKRSPLKSLLLPLQPRFRRALLAALVMSSGGAAVNTWAADPVAAPVAVSTAAPQAADAPDRDHARHDWTPEQRAAFHAKRQQARIAHKTEFFQQLDKNKDGQVTLAEWLAFQPEHGGWGKHHDGGRFAGQGDDRVRYPAAQGEFHPLANGAEDQPTRAPGRPESRDSKQLSDWMQHVDTNHDNQISLAEAQSYAPHLAKHFSDIDINHDGLISAAELQTYEDARAAKWHDRIEKHRTKVFEQADANHDGKLTLQEWLAYTPHHHGFWHRLWAGLFGHPHHHPGDGDRGVGRGDERGSDHRGGWFKHVDSNGDGQISLIEAQTNAPRLAEHFNEIDTDHNGQISQDELHAFFSARHDKSGS